MARLAQYIFQLYPDGVAHVVLVYHALETLSQEKLILFSLQCIAKITIEIIKIRPTFGYTLSASLISGAFLGYLNSAQ